MATFRPLCLPNWSRRTRIFPKWIGALMTTPFSKTAPNFLSAPVHHNSLSDYFFSALRQRKQVEKLFVYSLAYLSIMRKTFHPCLPARF
jgi:hypothetical protein